METNPKVANTRFVKAEQWRKQLTFADGKTPINPDGHTINLDEELANWDKDSSLKAKIAPYYPQYYHKTDKVGTPFSSPSPPNAVACSCPYSTAVHAAMHCAWYQEKPVLT